MRIEVTTHVEAPPSRVWDVLVSWEGQPRWLVGVRDVAVTSPHREGRDVTVRATTSVMAGLSVDDLMLVTRWDPPRALVVSHLGWPVHGVGAVELDPTPHGCVVTWWEELDVPFGAAGDAVAESLFAGWASRRLRRSVAGLKRAAERPELTEQPSADPAA